MINLMPTEKQVRITDQLYSLRNARRRHHGANWPAVVAEQKPLLDAIALAAVLAVAVEIIEPSQE